jgi:hypothetical protein
MRDSGYSRWEIARHGEEEEKEGGEEEEEGGFTRARPIPLAR